MSRPSLSVVIPLYYESGNVLPLVNEVHEALAEYNGPWELVLVDDGSQDATAEEMEQARHQHGEHVRNLHFPRNHGQTAAMQAGIDAARGELIATMDGDRQNDPRDIPRMVDMLVERKLDLLAGRRANRQDAWLSRKLPSRIANRLIARITGVKLTDYGCSLKVYRANVIKKVRLYGEMHRLIPVWTAMVTSPTRIAEIDVSHRAREVGESKYGISRTFRVLIDLLTAFFFLRFQARPGHFFGMVGMISGAIGGALFSYLMFLKIALGENIFARPLLYIALSLMLFAIQFITTGVLAEMIARVFYHGRPQVPLENVDDQGEDGWQLPEGTKPPKAPAQKAVRKSGRSPRQSA